MPRIDVLRTTAIKRSARVLQLEGLFDVPPAEKSSERWTVELPLEARDWSIGAIVGPSGAGKSTIARELFGPAVVSGYDWPTDRSVVDGFPAAMSIKDITGLLSSVGFSSPPAWLRPFSVLSTGQQFRVTLARALAEAGELVVVDEFTSVVDRTVAQIGSAAVAKSVRRLKKRFVAVTCHYDVIDWLQPDWIFEPHTSRFQWRELQRRPQIDLVITRCSPEAWALFRGHHYLSAELNRTARCFVATWRDQPVAFTAVLPVIGFKGRWREHRTVCLPDFQGIGLGMAQSSTVGAIVRAAVGGIYGSTTSHPAFIRARARSREWRMVDAPKMHQIALTKKRRGSGHGAAPRLMARFEYCGAPYPDQSVARALWAESFSSAKCTTQTRVSRVRVG
jgi:ABC-type lipoprotein export system ATPase subunit